MPNSKQVVTNLDVNSGFILHIVAQIRLEKFEYIFVCRG